MRLQVTENLLFTIIPDLQIHDDYPAFNIYESTIYTLSGSQKTIERVRIKRGLLWKLLIERLCNNK